MVNYIQYGLSNPEVIRGTRWGAEISAGFLQLQRYFDERRVKIEGEVIRNTDEPTISIRVRLKSPNGSHLDWNFMFDISLYELEQNPQQTVRGVIDEIHSMVDEKLKEQNSQRIGSYTTNNLLGGRYVSASDPVFMNDDQFITKEQFEKIIEVIKERDEEHKEQLEDLNKRILWLEAELEQLEV